MVAENGISLEICLADPDYQQILRDTEVVKVDEEAIANGPIFSRIPRSGLAVDLMNNLRPWGSLHLSTTTASALYNDSTYSGLHNLALLISRVRGKLVNSQSLFKKPFLLAFGIAEMNLTPNDLEILYILYNSRMCPLSSGEIAKRKLGCYVGTFSHTTISDINRLRLKLEKTKIDVITVGKRGSSDRGYLMTNRNNHDNFRN